MTLETIQHTDALELSHELKTLQYNIGELQQQLVLHYCATPPYWKTQQEVESLRKQLDEVDKHLEHIEADLSELYHD